jgi:hypothetical protein
MASKAVARGDDDNDDGDMFGDEFDILSAKHPSHKPLTRGTGAAPAAVADVTPEGAGPWMATGAAVDGVTPEGAGPPPRKEAGVDNLTRNVDKAAEGLHRTRGDEGIEAAAAVATSGVIEDIAEDDLSGMQGFELDVDSGMLYNSHLGFFFNPSTGQWRDAASGRWFTRGLDGQFVDANNGGGGGGGGEAAGGTRGV